MCVVRNWSRHSVTEIKEKELTRKLLSAQHLQFIFIVLDSLRQHLHKTYNSDRSWKVTFVHMQMLGYCVNFRVLAEVSLNEFGYPVIYIIYKAGML